MRIKIGRRTWLAALPGALALLSLFLWLPGAASALTLEKTISSGNRIAVLDMDVSAHGTVSNQIVVTTLQDGTRYDIVYAAGKAEKPTARFICAATKVLLRNLQRRCFRRRTAPIRGCWSGSRSYPAASSFPSAVPIPRCG